ncbi:MAG: signal recognition particle receptor subunit alpha [Candidatus Woesearchaeota archaeon]
MVLEKLGNSLKETLKKIAGALFVDERLVDELVKDIQRALLAGDVNVKLVFELTQRIRQKALKESLPKGLTKKEQLINIVYEELVALLGGEKAELSIKPAGQTRIMMIGLFGSGKTTSIGKLAKWLSKRGHRVATVGLDVHRPAAPEQLEQVSRQAGVACFVDKKEKDPLKIWELYEKKLMDYDVVIIDTAGRDALSTELIEELKQVAKRILPDETLLVISADIGQAALAQAQAFKEACGVTGVLLTKMDGTAKGGGALAACSVTGAPIKFIGVGEKLDDLESFNPKGFVGRLLGMGDIEALLEKAKEAVTEKEAIEMEAKFLKGEFTLMDLYNQMQMMSRMGPLAKITELIPGFGGLQLPTEVLSIQEEKLKKWRHAMDSMTKEELENPEIIDVKRIARISKGSGVSPTEIRDLIKQFKKAQKIMKVMKGAKSPEEVVKKLSKKGPMVKFKGK